MVELIPFIPLLGFLILGLFGNKMSEKAAGWLGASTILVAFVLSLQAFFQISASNEAIETILYTWMHVGNWNVGFGFLIDQLSVWMMLIITGIGFLIHVYSIGYMHGDKGFYKFFAYLNLFIFSMLLLVMGDSLVMLFFGWEGVGLCSYLLIGFWYQNKSFGYAARKAFIMNRIGDLALLLGIFLLFSVFGTVRYVDIFAQLSDLNLSQATLFGICILLFIGATGKSAQIPLYTWLPDAMAGPTPVSALIHAATMVTAGIYLIARFNPIYALTPSVLHIIAVVGLITSIWAALIALRQNDIKKVLAYSTVSQLGLMFLALGMGAYTTALFHVTTHAFFKALLFLAAGSVIHAMSNEQDIRNMGGLRKKLPITFAVFLIGTLAISGFPLLSGFFSKDEIFVRTFEHAGMFWWIAAVVSGLLTAVYMSRLLFVTFFGEFLGSVEQKAHLHESSSLLTVPLMILAGLSVFGGLLNSPHLFHLPNMMWLQAWLAPVIPMAAGHGGAHVLSEPIEWTLMGITTLAALVIIGVSYVFYGKVENSPVSDSEQSSFARLLANKFYVDEIYDGLFVRPLTGLSKMLHYYIDIWALDGIVNSVGGGVIQVGKQLRKLQNGNIEYYLLGMVSGIVFLMLAILYLL